jgi:hypothetical protein
MPFLGKTPAQGFVNSVTKDDFTPNGTATAFTLSKSPATVNEIEVYVGNVRQEPTDAYSVSGTTLTMTEAPATGTNFYVMHIGGTTQSSTVVGDGTVTSAKLSGALTTPSTLAVSGNATVSGNMTVDTTAGQLDIESLGSGSVAVKSDGSLKISSGGSGALDLLHGTTEVLNTLSTGVSAPLGVHLGGTALGNRLKHYESGTWTPVFSGDTSAGTYTYVEQQGHYVRVGNQVTAWLNLTNITTGSAGSGRIAITGLPFAANWMSGFNGESVGVIGVHGFTGINGLQMMAIIQDGLDKIFLYHFQNTSNTSDSVDVQDKSSDGSDIRGFVTYYIGG